MNEQDWKDYISYLKSEKRVELGRVSVTPREEFIKSFNIMNIEGDIIHSQRELLLIVGI